MSLFNMCCPKKPKMTLDYVIKWVGETDKTLKELVEWKNAIDSDIESLVKEAVENYDWSDLPQEALDHKADKVQEATEGNFAALDGKGNLTDSGYKASNFADANHSHNGINLGGNAANHILIEENDSIGRLHVQLWDSQEEESVFSGPITADMLNNTFDPATAPAPGNQKLITSGAVYTALQGKAPTTHSHSQIQGQRTATHVQCEEEEGTGSILISVEDAQEGDDNAEITYNNMPNLKRALQNPVAPAQGSDKLSTSGQIYTAISKKSDKEFCDKVYSRLMELEKNSSVEYGITATYTYTGNKPLLQMNGDNIIYDYDSGSEKIMTLYNVPYLHGLAFVGDVLVIKDLTVGTSLGTATVENFITGPNRMVLSGLSLPNDVSYNGKSIEIAITHGNY